MPINKRESLLFTFIMCFCMVLWMSIYNVALQHGAINGEVIAAAWLGFPVAYVFAMCCDWFVASPLAKGFAFKFLATPGLLALSSAMPSPWEPSLKSSIWSSYVCRALPLPMSSMTLPRVWTPSPSARQEPLT